MKEIILSPSKKRIPCEDGQTVLAALEKHGYVLPNNCRAGACGECKTKVLKGKFDQGFILDMALSKADREQGHGLMCMAKMLEDELEIEFSDEKAGPKLFPPQENLPYVLLEKIGLTKNIVKLRLKSLGPAMKFWPGQYVTLNGRSYSIANTFNQEGEILLFVTKVEGGKVSAWIHEELKVGEVVMMNGPYGTFIGNPQLELPVLCLAHGSGLAPILSLSLGALLRGGFRYPVTVLFSAKTKNDLFEVGTFKFLETKFRNFRFIPTLTQEPVEGMKHGRISEVLPALYPDLAYYQVYLAGSPEFVEANKKIALELGAKPENVFQEGFFPANFTVS